MLEGFFEQMGQWPVSQAIGASIWIYPTIQAIHLVFLALFAGGMMITDLRLLGSGCDRSRWLRLPGMRDRGS